MDEFTQELSDKLAQIYRNVIRLEEHALKEGNINLTIAEIHLVSLLSKHEDGLTVSHIADYMGVSRPTATVAVTKLTAKGYAVKQAVKMDGRQVKVYLSDEGRRVRILHKRCQRNVIAKLGTEFTQEQRKILLRAIDKLNIYFKTEGKADCSTATGAINRKDISDEI